MRATNWFLLFGLLLFTLALAGVVRAFAPAQEDFFHTTQFAEQKED